MPPHASFSDRQQAMAAPGSTSVPTLAAAGSTITDAAQLTEHYTVVTAADGTKGVKMPKPSGPGDEMFVYNSVADSFLKVYPHSGGDINDGTASAAHNLNGKSLGHYIAVDGTTWSTDFGEVMPVSFQFQAEAAVTEYDIFVAPYPVQVVAISCVPSVAQGGTMTATVVKATSTATPVKTTTPMHTADAINLNATAYTVQNITLTSTKADLALAAGDRIGVDYSAAPTTARWALTIFMRRLPA